MLQLPDPLVLHLQDGELLPMDGVRLRVEAGRVWVTRRDDLDDHFLDAGAAIDLPTGCGALVSGEGAARVRLSARARPGAQPRQVNGNASWRQNPLGT
jgi:hypothetical protein